MAAQNVGNGGKYHEGMIRRFEAGGTEALTVATLRAAGYRLEFTRGLGSVRVVDRHDNIKRMTWDELREFVDYLRQVQGREPLNRANKTDKPVRKRRPRRKPPAALPAEETP